MDETDRYIDNHSHRAAKRNTNAALMQGIVERHKRATNNGLPSSHRHESYHNLEHGAVNLDGKLIEIDGDQYSIKAVGREGASSPLIDVGEVPEENAQGNFGAGDLEFRAIVLIIFSCLRRRE